MAMVLKTMALKTMALKIMALNGDDLNGGIATIHGLRAAGDKRCV